MKENVKKLTHEVTNVWNLLGLLSQAIGAVVLIGQALGLQPMHRTIVGLAGAVLAVCTLAKLYELIRK